MEIKIKKKDFLEGLLNTQAVVAGKTTMPILSNVLIETSGDHIILSATDLQVALMVQVPAQIFQAGKITVLAKSLIDIVKESAHEDIRLLVGDNNKIELYSGSARFKISGLSASEFPVFPVVEGKPFDLPCDLLRVMFEKTAFSMATDETRYNLNGIFFQKLGEDEWRMVSTDGHRLSMIERKFSVASEPLGVIIPKKGVNELKKIVSKEGTVELSIGKKGLLVKKGNESLYVRFLDGNFPDHNAVVPKDNNIIISLNRLNLIGALRRVSLLSNEKSKGVVLDFSPGHLKISTTNSDLGEALEEFEIEYKGKKMTIGFNAHYLLAVLDVIREDNIEMVFKTEMSATLVRSAGDAGYTYVIMPMRI